MSGSAVNPVMLPKSSLHASLSDPVLETMNFLNEVTTRFPEAISFAPGRPYDGFFDIEGIVADLRRYLDHLAGQGRSPQQVRTAMYQYGPTAGQIRELIADSLRVDEQIDVAAESIVVTVGAQEGMLLVLRALIASRSARGSWACKAQTRRTIGWHRRRPGSRPPPSRAAAAGPRR